MEEKEDIIEKINIMETTLTDIKQLCLKMKIK